MPKKRNIIKHNERARLHNEKKRRLQELQEAVDAAHEWQQRHRSVQALPAMGGYLHDQSNDFGEEQYPPASEAGAYPQNVCQKLEDTSNEMGVRTSPSALADVRMEFDNSGVIHAALSSYKVEGT